jgi:hypothetical protein
VNRLTYAEKLKDVRWQKKRLETLERHNWRCWHCGKGEGDSVSLHVHHKYYERGREPWEYPDSCLIVYCEDCHAAAEELKHELTAAIFTHLDIGDQGYLSKILRPESPQDSFEIRLFRSLIAAHPFLTDALGPNSSSSSLGPACIEKWQSIWKAMSSDIGGGF